MRLTFIFLFITSISFGQIYFPKSDTIIYNKDGSESHYHVQSNAIQMTTEKNGTWNGPFRGYYRNGKLWVENNRINGSIVGKSIEYTPNGDTAKIEEWKDYTCLSRVIFYSSSRKDDQKYYFVSKKGVTVLLNGVYTKFDKSNAVDSLLDEGPDYLYMWLNGEKKLISGRENKFILITTGENPGWYRVEGDKQTFHRPMTEGEKKKFMPTSTEGKKKK